ncbi:RDD family protein [Pedobacter sandarakinus]|uniref:RDD family protein n=1 Tax=Pedobacter sandarakinus TaxID=353156 RepID=UPI002246AA59|nr:RDD family protein [Pedobacter sandarakinus]MCX2573466.1 RDD family protein [Pedobacter sandarakinus]
METIRISTTQNIDIEYEVAGLGERIAASCIDFGGFFVLYIISIILGAAAAFGNFVWGFPILAIIFAVVFVFYDLVCELTMDGQTFGKKALKIKVISIDGGQPTFSQYLLRWVFRLVDFTPIGWGIVAIISVAVTEKHQRVGDILAKTTLIKTTQRTRFDNLAFNFQLPDSYQPVFNEVIHLSDREIELVYEVLTGYYQTANATIVYAMAEKLKLHLSIKLPSEMNELQFLETVMKDYKYLTSVSV